MIWWTKSWNPVIGCTPCSPACENCYAEATHTMRHKALLAGKKMPECYSTPFDRVRFFPERLDAPLRWRKPQRIFVGNMGDLFHRDVQDAWLNRIFAVMACADSRHTFMLCTKRPERMAEYTRADGVWPLPNVLYGATVWDQPSMDAAAKHLLKMPAGARLFLSIEPMLGPVVIPAELLARLSWLVCGGETGPGARPMHPDWPRSLRDQCRAAEVPFFFKQWGEFKQKGGNHITEYRGSDATAIGWPDGTLATGKAEEHGGLGFMLSRVGKAKAGRVLDGRTWEEVPCG